MEAENSEFSRVKTTEDSVDPRKDFSLLMRTFESFLHAYDLSDLSTKWRLQWHGFDRTLGESCWWLGITVKDNWKRTVSVMTLGFCPAELGRKWNVKFCFDWRAYVLIFLLQILLTRLVKPDWRICKLYSGLYPVWQGYVYSFYPCVKDKKLRNFIFNFIKMCVYMFEYKDAVTCVLAWN